MPEFHWKDGWFFSRLADGSVRMEHRQYILEEPTGKYTQRYTVDVNVVIDPDAWASIVASVSALGEEHGRWHKAMEFHFGSDYVTEETQ